MTTITMTLGTFLAIHRANYAGNPTLDLMAEAVAEAAGAEHVRVDALPEFEEYAEELHQMDLDQW